MQLLSDYVRWIPPVRESATGCCGVDCNPRYVYLNPEGAKAVVAEAARNLSCVGQTLGDG